jgi:hypothetical protein
MQARHRLSKLLLRQGIVYYGGTPGPARTMPGFVDSSSIYPPPG